MSFDVAFAANAAAQVGDALGRTQPVWLSVAVGLHVAAQVCRGLAWREVLRVLWPSVTRERACAWHVCGAGLSGVLSARGGDAVRIALARRELRGSSFAALAGSLGAEGSFAAAFGLVLALVALAVGVGTFTTPSAELLTATAVGAAGVALFAWRSRRVRHALRDASHGASILRDPARFARRVLPWQLCNRVLRLGSVWCLLHAVGLPAGMAVVLAACAAQGCGNSIPLPGANVAAATAALIVALPLAAGEPVDVAAVAAMAIVAPATLTLVGLSISLVLACALQGASSPRELIRPSSSRRSCWRCTPWPPTGLGGGPCASRPDCRPMSS